MALADRVAAIFEKVFGIDPSEFRPDLAPEDVLRWDSLGHMTLVMDLEDTFDVHFEVDEITEMTSGSENHRSSPPKRSAGLARHLTATWPGNPGRRKPGRSGDLLRPAGCHLRRAAGRGRRMDALLRDTSSRGERVGLLAENGPLFRRRLSGNHPAPGYAPSLFRSIAAMRPSAASPPRPA